MSEAPPCLCSIDLMFNKHSTENEKQFNCDTFPWLGSYFRTVAQLFQNMYRNEAPVPPYVVGFQLFAGNKIIDGVRNTQNGV